MKKLKLNEPTEHQIQSAYFEILRLNENDFPELKYIFAIPNGGKRSIGVAVKMKREGVKRGVPDIFIPFNQNIPNRVCLYNGLWIETKTSTGTQSKEQKEYQRFLSCQQYAYLICRTVDEMIKATEEYLNITLKFK